ncbi:MAG TPA: hypothetical protein VFZ84_00550 [Burkholderiales bacterium]
MKAPTLLAALALGLALAAAPVSAQHMKTVKGIVVNIGIVKALAAEHVDAQHGVHKGAHDSGVEHVIVALAEEKSGARIADAEVSIELEDPKGRLQRKPMMAMVTAGYPDYSEVLYFGWSGRYTLRVSILRKGMVKPVQAVFALSRVL